MHLLNYLSESSIYFLFYISIFTTIFGAVLIYLPSYFSKFAVPVIFVSSLITVSCSYTIGIITNSNKNNAALKEIVYIEKEAAVKSQAVKEVVTIKYVDRVRVITQKGDEIIKYVDKEVYVNNSECTISEEVVDILNNAATNNGDIQ